MRFLRSVSGYKRIDKKRNRNITKEINVFNLEEIKEYNRNYLQCILRIVSYRIPWKLYHYHPKGRSEKGQPPKGWKD
jgi:hypothetical protein